MKDPGAGTLDTAFNISHTTRGGGGDHSHTSCTYLVNVVEILDHL